jgi:hypothetical protein
LAFLVPIGTEVGSDGIFEHDDQNRLDHCDQDIKLPIAKIEGKKFFFLSLFEGHHDEEEPRRDEGDNKKAMGYDNQVP